MFSMMLAMPVIAKDNLLLPLSPSDIPALKGKSVAIARPVKIKAAAVTPFGIPTGSPLIQVLDQIESSLEDPGDIVASQIAAALADQFEMLVLPMPVTGAAKSKLKEIQQTKTEADFLLDVRTIGWEFRHYKNFKTYTVNYSARVTLADMKNKRLLSTMYCNGKANAGSAVYQPELSDLLEDNGKLFKDLSGSLGWMCVHVLAKEQFRFDQKRMPGTPARYIDPLMSYRDRFLSQPDKNVDAITSEVDAAKK